MDETEDTASNAASGSPAPSVYSWHSSVDEARVVRLPASVTVAILSDAFELAAASIWQDSEQPK